MNLISKRMRKDEGKEVVVCMASGLYESGWRSGDGEKIKTEYGVDDEFVQKVCKELLKYEMIERGL